MDRGCKASQCFLVGRFVSKIFYDEAAAIVETVRRVSDRFIERMNVMQRASEQDRIETAVIKLRPSSNARIRAELLCRGNRLGITVNRDNRMAVLRQMHSQFACSTTHLKEASAFGRKKSLNKIVRVTRFEPHLSVV